MILGLLMAVPVFADQGSANSSSSSQQAAGASKQHSESTGQSMNQDQSKSTGESMNKDQSESTSQSMNKGQMDQSQTAKNFQPFNFRDLLGKNVKDQGGKNIGRVADVLFGKDGRADFIVLLSGGRKFTPIPFNTFMSNATNLADIRSARTVNTKLSKDKIDSAPKFASRYFDMSQSQEKICSYFGKGQCSFM
jgi:ribosomal 30S subunit maturation factor RimM